METLINKLSEKYQVFKGKGVSKEEVRSAELKLGFSFPEEYKAFLMKCGVLSFGAHEMFGLGVDGYLNVVESTMSERRLGSALPEGLVVIENLGIDGLLTVLDSEGKVFSFRDGKLSQVANSFFGYIEMLCG